MVPGEQYGAYSPTNLGPRACVAVDHLGGVVEPVNPSFAVGRGAQGFVMVDQVVAEFMGNGPKRRRVAESDHPKGWPGFAARRPPDTNVGRVGNSHGPIERHLGVAGVGSSPAVESD